MPRSPFRLFPGAVSAVLLSATLASAQHPANRIAQEIDSGIATQLPGSLNPRIAAARDIGRLNASAPIEGITLWFQPTPEQKAELDALVEAQQTPGSPLYHAWLTPAQYASRFGLSDADLARVQNWLESQGFNIDRVANSRTSITFSGTAAQVESAFQTQLHHYQVGAETHFANATDLAIPAALSGVVRAVGNLNDFRPAPHVRRSTLQPSFTSSQSGAHYLSPKDVGTIYDINAAWNAGYTGSGVTIVVVGQTAIVPADISAFQTAAGLTVKAPTITLVPNSGTSTVVQGDEAESDLDVEYAGGIAPGATINFIYTGNAHNYNVFDALQYAVDNRIGSIINISYGACEPNVSAAAFSALEGVMEQAATQGQTVVASSGDSGSTACYAPTTNTVPAAMEVLAVNYPASSVYAVGVGGTELTNVTSSTYWQSASGSDVVSSALSYIPEETWNDDSASIGTNYGAQYALSSGGGGISTLAARPSWQTGVPGIPSGSFRLVPDVSLASSPNNAPYLYCTSDQSSWVSGQKASCNSGFRDSATQDLNLAGGTSFAAPIFSGMLAIITQKQGGTGLGVANRTLYTLAANSSTYASAFHDITTGGNQCTAGASFCSSSGSAQYAAAAGYDEATGLGSVDFNNLMTAWAGTSGGGSGGGTGSASFALVASSASVTRGSSTTSTVQVSSQNSYSGTVGFTVTSTGSLLTYGCYTLNNAAISAGATANATLTIYTSKSACDATSGVHAFTAHGNPGVTTSRSNSPFGKTIPIGAAAFAGLLCVGFRKFRKASALLGCMLLVVMLGFASGCGSQSSNSTTSNSTASTNNQVSTGSYIVTVVGADTTTSGITASTTLTLTVN
jgi:subtilase family serine protease